MATTTRPILTSRPNGSYYAVSAQGVISMVSVMVKDV